MNHYNKNISALNIFFAALIVLFFSSKIVAQQSIIEKHTLQSHILNQKVNYSVILPENYYKSSKQYPVVYLLHGVGGDGESWINRCNMNRLIDSLVSFNLIADFIYIMPDAKNSYYIDNYDNSFCYDKFFIQEFVPHIDSTFRIISSPENRVLMGLSMGGFGAVMLGIKHPDKFGTIITMSGALRDSAIYVNVNLESYNQIFNRVFGPSIDSKRKITQHWKQNSPYYIIDSINAVNLRNLNWYIDCGADDFLYPASILFHELLIRYKIPHEFHSRPGKHNWEYWYVSSANALIYNSYLYKKKTNQVCFP